MYIYVKLIGVVTNRTYNIFLSDETVEDRELIYVISDETLESLVPAGN